MLDLRCDHVDRQRGDEVNDRVWNLGRDGHGIRIGQWRRISKGVKATGEGFDLVSVAHVVRRLAVHLSSQRVRNPQDAACRRNVITTFSMF